MELTTALVISVIVAIVLFAVAPALKRSDTQRRWEEKNRENQQREYEKRYAAGREIVEVKLLPGGSTVFRMGIVGQQLQKFAIKYSDGHVEIKEVHPDTLEYKKLMKYVKWEDIV